MSALLLVLLTMPTAVLNASPVEPFAFVMLRGRQSEIARQKSKTMREVMSTHDFQASLPAQDPVMSATKHVSCAVVGNSAVLRDARLGSQIDAHAAVMRVNLPPLGGSLFYSEDECRADVGRKTTHMFLNAKYTGLVFRLFRERNYTLDSYSIGGSPLFVAMESKIESHFERFLQLRRSGRDVHMFSGEFTNFAFELLQVYAVKFSVPSTGFLAALLALVSCDRVDLFGFGNASWPGNHFWDVPPRVLPNFRFATAWAQHQFAVELFLFEQIEQGKWPPPLLAKFGSRLARQVAVHHTPSSHRYQYKDHIRFQ